MSIVFIENQWRQEWVNGDNVDFDGSSRRIYIHPDVDDIVVRRDIYSAWKRWVVLQQNSAFPQALRTIGGDDIGGGQRAGDLYFLMNGWQIVVDHMVNIDGILYHDDQAQGITPYVIMPGGGVVATVSSLTQLVTNSVPVVTGDISAVPEAVWGVSPNVVAMDTMGALLKTINPAILAQAAQLSLIKSTVEAMDVNVTDMDANVTGMAGGISGVVTAVSDLTTAVGGVSTTVAGIDTSVDAVASAINAIATDVDGLVLGMADITVDTTEIKQAVVDVQTDVTNVLSNLGLATDLINTVLKYSANRSRVDNTAKTMTIYDNDGVTPLKVFDLRNFLGQPSVTEVAERTPR